ncbi:hypothetical protein PHMEG_00024992 [Phytophthora megakarya]|uniref:SET domain-containing protein n=1 Tax=Phytophthora megakarya TaxID=4795 RepID=A0A225VD31_9STRA|nr:hypothetical protein PHMEG_00024992 [Phytophthora megakarya]
MKRGNHREDAPTTIQITIDRTEREFVSFPVGVYPIKRMFKASCIDFEDVGAMDKCRCVGDCIANLCLNSKAKIFCTKANCGVGGTCGNSLREHGSLKLFKTTSTGVGVCTTTWIAKGTLLGEYFGVLEGYVGNDSLADDDAPQKVSTGYSLLLNKRSNDGRFVYYCLEAKNYGGTMTVVVVTLQELQQFEEVTVSYSTPLGFTCLCTSCATVDGSESQK